MTDLDPTRAPSGPDSAAPDYPLTLDLRGRRVLVVGGGPVALRRIRRLLDGGARIDVVAPQATPALADLARAGALTWHARPYAAADLTVPSRAWLVHTATGVDTVDGAVAADADAEAIWCARADDAARSRIWSPAVGTGTGEAAGIQVAVTGGGDPRRAVALRDAILLGLETGELPSLRLRPARRVAPPDAVEGCCSLGDTELPPYVAAAQRAAEACGCVKDAATRDSEPEPTVGRVALIGGGPGAEDLLTVRARRLLARADVVVTDRLGPTSVLDRLGPNVEVINVGKLPGHHPVPQWEINDILVHHAKQGAFVVRLKGGDPFVLGRGGEEMLYCAAHGVPVEVVPGVTSAVSVPAAAGIPVTHRDVTASFVVASGHDGPASVLAAARDAAPDATLVLLMGVSQLGETAAALIASGRRANTPVAIIESGWTPAQRTTMTHLARADADARAAGVRPPAVVVVGDVVAVREEFVALGGLDGAGSRVVPAGPGREVEGAGAGLGVERAGAESGVERVGAGPGVERAVDVAGVGLAGR